MRTRSVAALSVLATLGLSVPALAAAGGWHIVAAPDGGSVAGFAATSFTAPDDGWAVGSRGVSLSGTGLDALTEHWDGTAWRIVPSLSLGNSNEVLTGVSGATADDAWAVGWCDPYGTVRVHGLMLHWNGTRWSITQDAPHTNIPIAVDARTSSDVWAVGNDLLQHFDGTAWTAAPVPQVGSHLRSVVVLAANNAWAVGSRDDPRPGYHHDNPLVLHWDGSAWSPVATPFDTVTGSYTSVSAVSASDIWAVGTNGSQSADPVAIHFDGTQWHAAAMPGPGDWDRLSAVVAISANDVWAVGDRNGALPDGFAVLRTFTEHWDGTHWSVVASPNDSDADNYLTAVAESGGTVWAFGADGNTLVQRRAG